MRVRFRCSESSCYRREVKRVEDMAIEFWIISGLIFGIVLAIREDRTF
jgi:hypothetical protein